MPAQDSNAKQVGAMKPGETRWVSWGVILRLQARNSRDEVIWVDDQVALSLVAIGTLVERPHNSVRVTRDSREYKVHLESGELDFLRSLGNEPSLPGYAIAKVVPR